MICVIEYITSCEDLDNSIQIYYAW